RHGLPRCPPALHPLPRLSPHLGVPTVWVKRDDQTGLGLGGNKTRKLEFLLAEARATGCDTVVTGGALQSNHCHQTAAAAARLGIACHLALGAAKPPAQPTGNLLLDQLLGAELHFCGDQRKGESLPALEKSLRAQGRKPYVIPYGGSNALGTLALAAAVGELVGQLQTANATVDAIVVASSSGGTQAGLALGLAMFGLPARLVGIAVDKHSGYGGTDEGWLADLANAAADHIGYDRRFEAEDFDVRRNYLGAGYGVLGEAERRAIATVATQEGLLLDPVYSGRAMAGLMDLVTRRAFARDETVLFWHTGGTPALFAYGDALLASP
ncbi:MAG: D-cysteine desulfhydrase family protein, partial [Candidatus Competibacterales bacterium]